MSKKRDYGEGTVYKRGNTWYCGMSGKDPKTGKRSKKFFSAPTKTEAVAKKREYQKLLELGIDTTTRDILLRNLLPAWLDAHCLANNLSESSRKTYATMSEKILSAIGDYKVGDVNPTVLDKLLTIDKEVTAITVRRYRLVKSLYADLELRGEIDRSPFVRHRGPKKPATPEAYYLEKDQIDELLEAVSGSPIANITKFLLASGCRIGEALALRWSDVDLDSEIPTVAIVRSLRTNEGTAVFTDGKTKNSRRGIEISAPTVQVLQAQKLTLDAMAIVRDGWEDHDLVFPSSVGTPQDTKNLRKIWNKCLKGTSIEGKATFHTCRHSHASMSLMKGESIFVISRRLGHADATITMNLYSHLMKNQQSIAAAAMDEFILKVA